MLRHLQQLIQGIEVSQLQCTQFAQQQCLSLFFLIAGNQLHKLLLGDNIPGSRVRYLGEEYLALLTVDSGFHHIDQIRLSGIHLNGEISA